MWCLQTLFLLLNSKAYQKYEAMALEDQKRKQAAKEKVSTSDLNLTGIYHALSHKML